MLRRKIAKEDITDNRCSMKKMNNQHYLKSLLLSTALLLSACSFNDNGTDIFDNYIYRLNNSLNVPSEHDVAKNTHQMADELMRYPQKKLLTYTFKPSSINLLDFLRLSQCELQRHIGQRNSSLGRFMKPSQTLLYEYEFIVLASQCVEQLDDAHELSALLSSVVADKRLLLSQYRWNAFFSSDETISLFSLSSSPLNLSQLQQSPVELYSALTLLHRVFDANDIKQQTFYTQAQQKVSIEQAFAVIASSKRVGELRLSMELVRRYLRRADHLLAYRLSQQPLCLSAKPNPQFEIVNTVFVKFYIGEVQPYLSALHQQAKAMLQHIDALVQQLEPTPAFTVFWQDVYLNENSEWQRFDRAIGQHTKNWQALLTQCGRLPI